MVGGWFKFNESALINAKPSLTCSARRWSLPRGRGECAFDRDGSLQKMGHQRMNKDIGPSKLAGETVRGEEDYVVVLVA